MRINELIIWGFDSNFFFNESAYASGSFRSQVGIVVVKMVPDLVCDLLFVMKIQWLSFQTKLCDLVRFGYLERVKKMEI